jgi:hypothetical protein
LLDVVLASHVVQFCVAGSVLPPQHTDANEGQTNVLSSSVDERPEAEGEDEDLRNEENVVELRADHSPAIGKYDIFRQAFVLFFF